MGQVAKAPALGSKVEGAVLVRAAGRCRCTRVACPVERRMTRFYRTVWCVLALTSMACGEAVYDPPRFTLSGTITDSVTGVPVFAALVSVSGGSAVSDTAGDFFVPVDSGSVELRVTHEDYEKYATTLQLVESQWNEIGLRRVAPYVRDYLSVTPFSGDDSSLETALVGDLQGYANTDTTRGEAQLWFGDTPFELSISHESEDVEWVYSDSLTMQVAIWLSTGLSPRDSVLWTLFDFDGHSAKWICYPAGYEPECVERS